MPSPETSFEGEALAPELVLLGNRDLVFQPNGRFGLVEPDANVALFLDETNIEKEEDENAGPFAELTDEELERAGLTRTELEAILN